MVKILKKISYTALLLAIGVAHAATPCDGFKINLKNTLPDDLLVREMSITGAHFDPSGIPTIGSRTESTFTINGSADHATMPVRIVLNTVSLPTKKVVLNFNLVNKGLICKRDNVQPNEGELEAVPHRTPNNLSYTIK